LALGRGEIEIWKKLYRKEEVIELSREISSAVSV
jgi:hypothetical protein